MYIDTLILGSYENNCYIVRRDYQAKNCLIIDTGLDAVPLTNFLQTNNLNPVALILTHGHADHIVGVGPLRKMFPEIKVCIHKADAGMLTDSAKNLSMLAGVSIVTCAAEVIIESAEPIEYAGIRLDVIHTPGHTQGGICLYSREEKTLFSGDTLFAGSIGRTDFNGQDKQKCFGQLIGGIKKKLMILSEETRVLSGHGPATTIGNEKKHNPYLQ